jgi:hypothetical protein
LTPQGKTLGPFFIAVERMVAPSGFSIVEQKIDEPVPPGLRRDQQLLSAAASALTTALEPVIVDEPLYFSFDTSISRKHLLRFWTWVARDIVPDIEMRFDGLVDAGNTEDAAIEICLGHILAGIEKARADASDDDADRRLTLEVGGQEVRERLDIIVLALKSRSLIEKARGFDKSLAPNADATALGLALQSLPLRNPAPTGLLMHTIVGRTAMPSRLVAAASAIAGGANEEAIRSAGFGPLGDAILAHAQNQLSILTPTLAGMGDIDAASRSLDRFHRLIRSLGSYLALARNSHWSTVITELTKQVSLRLEPRLMEIGGDIAQSMRRSRDSLGNDRFDAERLLAALNGMYLLSAVRECRESLALNALFDEVWNQTGQSIEILVKRNLEEFRRDPDNEVIARRLEGGIKLAEIRFGMEYAEVLRRARDKLVSRPVPEI